MRDWRSVFGPPAPAGYTHTSVDENDLRRILLSALPSDTDLLIRSWRLIVAKEPARIREIASALGNPDSLRSASILILVGIEKSRSHANLVQFTERIETNQPGFAQFERYRLATEGAAFPLWLGGAAARCATRLSLAARSLGYSSAVFETFEWGTLRALVAAPQEIDFPIVVSIGGTVSQREGEGVVIAPEELMFSERWGQGLDLSSKSEATLYRDCLVSYFDILGFRHMVEVWGPEKIRVALAELLSLSSQDFPLRRVTLRGLSTFSDHVVRTVPLDGLDADQLLATVQFELSEIQHIQANLAIKGIFVRGAVTRGPIYISDEIVFGPALVRAYELEQKAAIYPRIVFDNPKVTAEIQLMAGRENMARFYSDYLFQGDDQEWSVNYLQAGDELGERLRLLKEHAEVLRRNLAEVSDSAVVAKYQWLAKFHNSIVEQISESDLAKYGQARAELQLP
jgi:nitroreductase